MRFHTACRPRVHRRGLRQARAEHDQIRLSPGDDSTMSSRIAGFVLAVGAGITMTSAPSRRASM